ncbi:hypothetical protein LUX12_22580 [Streptomyces somaliensis]|nr:hypothetical protein [Streptomyces somaliensis]MCP9946964.1 hypothetical protein [Streptomyces somaliensis]MCP9963599.1 hypothetical protein [Streptomyces somaliensis]MCP9972824.1 hypothetical protein [Streptomyces somaliensis]MCP9976071.1 hypothetical protein [Streptomyces somaliensis]MCP9976150.1 hypothetical protein [Streptomyces somaliensis]
MFAQYRPARHPAFAFPLAARCADESVGAAGDTGWGFARVDTGWGVVIP